MFLDQGENSTEQVIADDDHQTPAELSSTDSKQNRVNMAITKYLIVKCNLPLNLVENSAFRQFMKECNWKWNPISSKKLKADFLGPLTDHMNKIIHETLNDIKYVTLTVDGWSDRKSRSFIGVTCHFINDKFEPQTMLIDFVRFKSPHTGENIYCTTETILDHYNLKEKVYKIVKIVTDNASSMIKAYKFGLSGDDENNDNDQTALNSNTATTWDDDQDAYDNNWEFMNIKYSNDFEDENPTDVRLSCFIHSLQLCVRDGLKNASHIPTLLKKCQAVAKFAHQSVKVADLLEDLNKHINKMNITRWNSEFLFIKSFLSLGKTDLESITSLMDHPVKFSKNDFIVLEEVIDILEPFYEVSVTCQADIAVTASLVVPSIVHLTSHLRDIKPSISLCLKLVQQLESSIKLRFSGIINRFNLIDNNDNPPYGDPLYFIAVVLDPQFKFFWIRDLQLSVENENRLKQHIIDLIINEMKKDSTPLLTKSSNATLSSIASSFRITSPRKKRRRLFHYEDNIMNDLNESSTLDPCVELDGYLNDPIRAKFSDYWFHSKLNMLKSLVKRTFSVQASSATIESVFSHAGLILSSRRTNMNEY